MYYYNVLLYITCRPTNNYSCVYAHPFNEIYDFEVFTYIILYHLIHHFRVFFIAYFVQNHLNGPFIFCVCMFIILQNMKLRYETSEMFPL